MVHGYHIIFGAYGFWLPNDPRGSWSDFVYSWELARYGNATRSPGRVDVAPREYAAWREAATSALRYPVVSFSDEQIRQIGDAFGKYVQRNRAVIWACSILPEHVHLVLGRNRYSAEQVVNLLKGNAQNSFIRSGTHPHAGHRTRQGKIPSMWADKRWVVFLDHEESIDAAIRYVENNPVREGRPVQHWPFVTSFPGISQGGWTTYHSP